MLLVLFGVCFLFFKKDEEIRVRVISNSDSEIDLLYKEEVVSYLKSDIFPNLELTDESFRENYKAIEEMLNLKFDQITVTYQNHTFNNKTYNGSVLENDSYMTLLICIGNAMGSNWWGSIFASTLQKESSELIKYEWYFKRKSDE